MMVFLFEVYGDKVPVTEAVTIAAAKNTASNSDVMKLLLDRRGDDILITEPVVEAAAENCTGAVEVVKFFLIGVETKFRLLKRLSRRRPGTEGAVEA